MTLKQYFLLTQIESTTTSFFPAFIGILYAWYNYDTFRLGFSLLGLLTAVLFHMAVNIRDNYLDYSIADNKNADYAQEMVVAKENIPLKNVRLAYWISGIVALIIGLYLVLQTSPFLFFIGFGGMLIGALYTMGPVPINSTPYGEFFVGLAMGFGIFTAMVYVNSFDVIRLDWITIIQLIVASIPTSITVMAISIANNICDVEEDIEDNRFTLPYYIGVDKALVVFKYFYYAAYIAIILSLLFGTFPKIAALSLLTFPYVLKNIRVFTNDPNKKTTFIATIINSAVIPVPIILTLFIGAWLDI